MIRDRLFEAYSLTGLTFHKPHSCDTTMTAHVPPVDFSPQLLKELKTEFQEPISKRPRCDEWSSSSGSSPSHSEELHVDTTTTLRNVLESQVSSRSDEGSVNENGAPQTPLAGVSTFAHTNVAGYTNDPAQAQYTYIPICQDSRYSSFAEFEASFERWKREQLHPFRVASSETLKEPDGTVNSAFRYRYVVYHCAHYGEPRMRGVGKRPNQSYLPCGCHAMLRLNYSFTERVLKVTTLVTEHTGHEQTPEFFLKVVSKMRSSPAGSPAARVKKERISSASPLSYRPSPATSSSGSHQTSPTIQNNSAGSYQNNMLQQQQQLIAALIQTQQKENYSALAQHQLQYALGSPLPRSASTTAGGTGAMLNILNMMSLPFVQPAHGVVASQAASDPKPTAVQDHIDVVNDFSIPHDLPAPVAVRVSQPSSPPPQLKAEMPFFNELTPLRPVSSSPGARAELHDLLVSLTSHCADCSEEEATARLEQLKELKTQWGLSLSL